LSIDGYISDSADKNSENDKIVFKEFSKCLSGFKTGKGLTDNAYGDQVLSENSKNFDFKKSKHLID
jgi:hypothetical protein